jgi:hypothetical protein
MDPTSLIEDKNNSGELPNNLRENTYYQRNFDMTNVLNIDYILNMINVIIIGVIHP